MNFYRHFRFLYRLIIPLCTFLFPVHVHHEERLPDGPMVVCAPHSSFIDPLLIMAALTIQRFPRYLAKKELFSIPIIGWVLRWVGMIPVERGKADMVPIKTALSILKQGGIIGIFPEGTRVRDEHAAEAKTGAVMLASRTGASILPVWLPRGKKLFRTVDVVIGEPYHLPKLRGNSEYHSCADDLMSRIDLLKKEAGYCI